MRSPRRARTAWHVRQPLDTDAIRARRRGAGGRARLPRLPRLGLRPQARRAGSSAASTSTARAPLLTFDIEATAFLKNMVRIIVGTLVDIGRGRIPEDARHAHAGDRRPQRRRHDRAAAHGLTLLRVIY